MTIDLSSPFLSADPRLADCLFLAALETGHPAEPLLGRLFATAWRERRDIEDAATVAAVAVALGLPSVDLVERARSAEIQAAFRASC